MTSVETDPSVIERTEQIVAEGRQGIEDATFDLLMKKPRRESSFLISVPNDDGSVRQVRVRYRALSPTEYDDLVAAHPPTPKHKADGSTWNIDTFPPALIAACSYVPKMTYAQAKDLYGNENYAPGEQRALFYEAMDVCAQGLNLPFSVGD